MKNRPDCVSEFGVEERCSVSEAAKVIGWSDRHVWRLLAAYREEGAAALLTGIEPVSQPTQLLQQHDAGHRFSPGRIFWS